MCKIIRWDSVISVKFEWWMQVTTTRFWTTFSKVIDKLWKSVLEVKPYAFQVVILTFNWMLKLRDLVIVHDITCTQRLYHHVLSIKVTFFYLKTLFVLTFSFLSNHCFSFDAFQFPEWQFALWMKVYFRDGSTKRWKISIYKLSDNRANFYT